ncbi:hypothetical protein [Aureivirga sp. CE67]|uniref:hypothetical protein n=1 Tax=Aureivirga sp. CE67 TaxID=1788983 RepID=UPI0018CA06DC|nr:hypothetical protein [Aureivirga sp. CE67]
MSFKRRKEITQFLITCVFLTISFLVLSFDNKEESSSENYSKVNIVKMEMTPEEKRGEELFNKNCVVCHKINSACSMSYIKKLPDNKFNLKAKSHQNLKFSNE